MSAGSADQLTPLTIVMNVGISFLIGMFIFYIYKKCYQGVLYQKSFNISLVVATTVTSLVIMTISGNLILSLGMVGALSIVRFRTPIKDSMDLVFLFWAISAGIANGVGYYNISIIGAALISLIILYLTRKGDTESTYLLILQTPAASNDSEIIEFIKSKVEKFRIKSKVVADGYNEMTIEIKINDTDIDIVDQLQKDGLAEKATLVTYSNDLASV